MLKKMLYYDFRALGRINLPVLLGALGISLLAFGSNMILLYSDGFSNFAATIIGSLSFFGCMLLLYLALAAPLLIFIVHVYRNLYGDEGYLTLVLPATEHEQLLSKFLSGFFWALIEVAVGAVALGLATVLPNIIRYAATMEESIPYLSEYLGNFESPLYMILSLINGLLTICAQLMLAITAITTGSLVMPKHKIFGSILFFLLIDMAIGLISTLFNTLVFASLSNTQDYVLANSLLSLLLEAGLLTGMYFLSVNALKKHVNLE